MHNDPVHLVFGGSLSESRYTPPHPPPHPRTPGHPFPLDTTPSSKPLQSSALQHALTQRNGSTCRGVLQMAVRNSPDVSFALSDASPRAPRRIPASLSPPSSPNPSLFPDLFFSCFSSNSVAWLHYHVTSSPSKRKTCLRFQIFIYMFFLRGTWYSLL